MTTPRLFLIAASYAARGYHRLTPAVYSHPEREFAASSKSELDQTLRLFAAQEPL